MAVWAKKVTGWTWHPGLGNSPAAVSRSTGMLFLNPRIWPNLTDAEKRFILEHEFAHIRGRVTDELATDRLAFAKYVKHPQHSLRAAMSALIKNFNFNNPEHMARLEAMLNMAQQHERKLKFR